MLTLFGTVAVSVMLVSYWLEPRSRWLVLVFAAGCGLTALYSYLATAYPITVIEAVWAAAALHRFMRRSKRESERQA